MSKAISLKGAKAKLKIDEEKLEKYLRYYNDEILLTPDPEHPHKEAFTPTELEMFQRYRRVFSMFDIGRTDEWIRSVLEKEYGIEWRQARNIVNTAYALYGVLNVPDREGRKRASINYYRTLSNLAIKDKDYDTAAKLNEKADKLEGLFEPDNGGLNPDDFKHPTQFIFTDNINVLNQRQKELDPDD
jgi:hypothetical protein